MSVSRAFVARGSSPCPCAFCSSPVTVRRVAKGNIPVAIAALAPTLFARQFAVRCSFHPAFRFRDVFERGCAVSVSGAEIAGLDGIVPRGRLRLALGLGEGSGSHGKGGGHSAKCKSL